MENVRVRFAPSPTGSTHIGTVRTALFNWLFARKTGGTFVLRIEDTDAERNTQEALDELLEGLRWLGIDWDEGPEKNGSFGPYFQSQRDPIYQSYLQKLADKGRTYEKDGATYFRLLGDRYNEFDKYLDQEVEKVKTEPVVIDDIIRGQVTRREERDFVLVRSNGAPSFHFVNVVDDIAMQISHVIRGEDHLSNTSKHIELYKALNAEAPSFAHLPMILKNPKDGKGKMSKRDKGALISEYRERNFLPDAVRNFIALLGWSPKDDQEILGTEELIERFDLKDVQKGGARFDEKKMSHLNFEYMKRLPIEAYEKAARKALVSSNLINDTADSDYLRAALELCREKIDSFENLPAFSAYFFTDDFPVNEMALNKVWNREGSQDRLAEIAPRFKTLDEWSAPAIEGAFQQLSDEAGEKPFAWYPVVRFAVSGTNSGPDFLPMLELLGKERVLRRINARLAGSL
jgi:glutamyl-tRNA synthetase